MMKKSLIKAAQRVVKKGTERVVDNAINRELQATVGVGYVSGRHICFSVQDRLAIESYFSKQLNTPLREVELDARDRVEVASQVENEKWASGTVFESLLNIASTKPIPTRHGDVTTPFGCVFSLALDNLDLARIDRVVIVENGAAVVHWENVEYALPDQYKGALILYRGHGGNQRQMKALINRLPASARLCVYCDFDPAGLSLAISIADGRPFDLAVPACSHDDMRAMSKADAYNEQYEILTVLTKSSNAVVGDIANLMMANRLAITQEKIMANRCSLKTVHIKTKTLR
tara:strand:- start:3190 stop:4056 length:867 start_codon:yes stop_codon:yes gene_type:complete